MPAPNMPAPKTFIHTLPWPEPFFRVGLSMVAVWLVSLAACAVLS